MSKWRNFEILFLKEISFKYPIHCDSLIFSLISLELSVVLLILILQVYNDNWPIN